ncbi:diphosphomevalonate decarboxylase [Cryobacterium mesophilum]|uniref:diphosphomevalonate decarboxylase n=1 Tax=Terrimesophilobacter mesophilus TaxID=433647 RepID=A0A4R8VC84_9MICO|nr:diphosphomevalonate decarboxylase [Terrimesophilobacter mesophilus]MBB5633584.1 diphosphomevalonate decarboxylase [Terrimesophilobacter mesophilus]TFB80285.1 diphosphomevalonate decarboxylase [Terrimesophilobacter mesophilus]
MEHTNGGDTSASAQAHSNIALAKYWGKRDAALNIPAVGSISITLDALHTDTRVTFDAGLTKDELWLDGREQQVGRAGLVLDLVRERAGIDLRARVVSENNFPTGAGLASSASGFAALAVAATAAAGIEATPRELSVLARRGSASAARSIFGGYAELHAGESTDGNDSFAEPLLDGDAWPLSVVVAITDPGQKAVSSTVGMQATSASSPFYPAWVESAPADLDRMRAAILAHDLETVGELAEHSCLALHSLMLTTRPALIYWNAATMSAIHAVRGLRAGGLPVYFTIDAGPQVKALCLPADAAAVASALTLVPGVQETRTSVLGPAAHLVAVP